MFFLQYKVYMLAKMWYLYNWCTYSTQITILPELRRWWKHSGDLSFRLCTQV